MLSVSKFFVEAIISALRAAVIAKREGAVQAGEYNHFCLSAQGMALPVKRCKMASFLQQNTSDKLDKL